MLSLSSVGFSRSGVRSGKDESTARLRAPVTLTSNVPLRWPPPAGLADVICEEGALGAHPVQWPALRGQPKSSSVWSWAPTGALQAGCSGGVWALLTLDMTETGQSRPRGRPVSLAHSGARPACMPKTQRPIQKRKAEQAVWHAETPVGEDFSLTRQSWRELPRTYPVACPLRPQFTPRLSLGLQAHSRGQAPPLRVPGVETETQRGPVEAGLRH